MIEGGELLDQVRQLVIALAGATIRLDIRSFARRKLTRHSAWTGTDGAVLASHLDDRQLELGVIPPQSLADALRALVGPVRSCTARAAESDTVRLPSPVLTRFVSAMAANDAARAASQLAAVRDDLPALRLLHDLALGKGRAWSIERRAAPAGIDARPVPSGPVERSMSVVEASAGGGWVAVDADRFEPVDGVHVDGLVDEVTALAPEPGVVVDTCPSGR